MAENRRYTDEDRARVLLALRVNNGNAKRTARETNIPLSTIRAWKRKWDSEGPSNEIMVLAETQAENFVDDMTRIRDKALLEWENKVNTGEVSARDLMTGIGVLTDKINIAKGLSRKSEQPRPAIEPAAMRELARGLVEGAINAAREREAEIVDVEFEEVEHHELTRGTS